MFENSDLEGFNHGRFVIHWRLRPRLPVGWAVSGGDEEADILFFTLTLFLHVMNIQLGICCYRGCRMMGVESRRGEGFSRRGGCAFRTKAQ